MDAPPGPDVPPVSEPDYWLSYWTQIHPDVVNFGAAFRDLARSCLADPFEEGVGTEVLRFREDDDREVEAEVSFILEQHADGRVMHLQSVRSPGDPLPPWLRDKSAD